MFGNKLRAWMEAVRPKKKQHRKDKQGKNSAVTIINDRPNTSSHHTVTWKNSCLLDSEQKEINRESSISSSRYVNPPNDNGTDSQMSRYSANNLSSPESAYSTGYSTDGTSPGGVPSDYAINSSDKKSTEISLQTRLNPQLHTHLPCSSKTTFQCFSELASSSPSVITQEKIKVGIQGYVHCDLKAATVRPNETQEKPSVEEKEVAQSLVVFGKATDSAALMSPRQRNRIRTNPWLPGGSTSAVPSPLPVRQEVKATPLAYRKMRNSPIQHRYLSPATHRRSLSSSSCSSLSAGQIHSFEHRFPRSLSDEDDCTLNEMMGKYDESYVYEKETDILSDSDPTDCESDIDTGQDGGDEEDNGEEELDFIDNGSYIEIDSKTDNTGHCMYIMPSDMQRKRSSRRRTTRRGKEASDRRRRSSSNKKNNKPVAERTRHSSWYQDGSKSAGATPVSVRKSNLKSNQHRIPEESLKKRSNSVCLQRDVNVLLDKRDREADIKYKELIGQAEQIIRTMNINGLSPRRLPGPTNKRVELLRSTECAKPEVLFMGKPNDETLIPNSNISPSTLIFKNTRFSPKKNHITNFIINNSPVLVRKEQQGQSPISIRRILPDEGHRSPLAVRRQSHQNTEDICRNGQFLTEELAPPPISIVKKSNKEHHEVTFGSPRSSRRNHKPKSILHKTEPIPAALLSPRTFRLKTDRSKLWLHNRRHRRKTEYPVGSSSSEEEDFQKYKKKLSKSCPQSEPMRRKVYFGRNTINIGKSHGKMVAFNLNTDPPPLENKVGSSENLRHQVLLNTIQSLKKNLEDHSASLQQTYRSTQNMYKY